jgi:ATP-dependent DNA helicase RecG
MLKLGRFGTEIPDTSHDLLVRLYLVRNNLLTNAAMVLFATDPLLWAPNLWIRIVSYASEQREELENDTVFTEPAVRAVKKAISAIQQRTGVSGQFSATDVSRQQRPAYALFALREGLVNAAVHRDYDRPGQGVLVEIFPEKLVISNPGSLPDGWSGKDLERKHESRPANPDIARIFYLRGLMEQLGLGTQKVIAACEELGAKRPKWEAARGTVSLTLHRAPEPRELLQVESRQRSFLHGYKVGQTFKVADYAKELEVTERHARRELGELERKGLVAREGAGPSTAYRVAQLPH